jgi:signal transduction histidine kinase
VRTVNSLARGLGIAWLGVVAFALAPPSGLAATLVQAIGYAVAVLAVAGWILLDVDRRAARYHAGALPVVCGVLAVATGAAAGAGTGGEALLIFTFLAALTAGGAASLVAAVAVTAAGVLAFEASSLAFGASVATLLGLAAVIASGLVIGRNWSGYRVQAEQSAALLAQRDRLEAEQRRADLLDERTRIAREIHDVLAHSLGALSIQIQAARSVLTDRGDIGRAEELLAGAQRMAAEGLVETRRAVQALRSDTLPLGEELAKVTETYARRYGVPVSFDTRGTPQPLPPDATIALLRVAQEALVNAAKHAPGQHVVVRLDYADTDVTLVVRNALGPGVAGGSGGSSTRDVAAAGGPGGSSPRDVAAAGGPPGSSPRDAAAGGGAGAGVRTADAGYGLTGMRERLRLLNGTLEAGARDGQWIVTAQLPRTLPETMAS